jgi:hypothetical protein
MTTAQEHGLPAVRNRIGLPVTCYIISVFLRYALGAVDAGTQSSHVDAGWCHKAVCLIALPLALWRILTLWKSPLLMQQ